MIGGGQIGWNWQSGSNWLWGLEADFQGSGEKNNSIASNQDLAGAVLLTTLSQTEDKLKWFGTVRLRTGYVVGNTTLLYVTGGGAYGRVQSFESAQRTPNVVGNTSFLGGQTVSDTKWGWTVGAGAETRLGSNWSAKLEYLYLDLGKLQNNYPLVFNAGALNGTTLANVATTTKFTDHVFRVGLNYAFGGR